jgi:hypothetical protein
MLDPIVEHAISGCNCLVTFHSASEMARAVGTLLACHQHHFVVIPDAGAGLSIACSHMATRCLMEHLGPDTFGYSAPMPPPMPPPSVMHSW